MSADHHRFMWIQVCVTRPAREEPNFEPEIYRMESSDHGWALSRHGNGPRYGYSLWRRLTLAEIQSRANIYTSDSGRRYFLRHLRPSPLGTIIRIRT